MEILTEENTKRLPLPPFGIISNLAILPLLAASVLENLTIFSSVLSNGNRLRRRFTRNRNYHEIRAMLRRILQTGCKKHLITFLNMKKTTPLPKLGKRDGYCLLMLLKPLVVNRNKNSKLSRNGFLPICGQSSFPIC